MIRPYVSVVIITYNQDQYIHQAIDSVLEQTDCREIEIIVGDDASTDNTKKILEEYKKKHPNVFTIISRKNNLGPSSNLYELFSHCTGEFVALLEGDDFWTNPRKLKEQTDFLEINESHVACTHRYKVVDESGGVLLDEYHGVGRPKLGVYTLEDFQNYKYFGLLSSLVFRNILINEEVDYSIIKNGDNFIADITLNLFLCFQGKVEVLDINMAAHRMIVNANGTNYKSIIQKSNQIMSRILYLERLEEYAKKHHKYKLTYVNRREYYFAWSILFFMRYPSMHNFRVLIFTYKYNNSKARLFWYLASNIGKLSFQIKKQVKSFFS
jgi:glycosyltransferase involved in cell wall biosynthesis